MLNVPGKFVLKSEVPIQTRRAQAVDPQLALQIRRTCEANEHIAACYLLDARKPEAGEIGLIIALTLDDPATHIDLAILQFQAMLRQFPTQAGMTVIMLSTSFAHDYAGAEFYVRRAA